MFDLSQPVPDIVIVGSLLLMVLLFGIGLGIVAYYKKKLNTK